MSDNRAILPCPFCGGPVKETLGHLRYNPPILYFECKNKACGAIIFFLQLRNQGKPGSSPIIL